MVLLFLFLEGLVSEIAPIKVIKIALHAEKENIAHHNNKVTIHYIILYKLKNIEFRRRVENSYLIEESLDLGVKGFRFWYISHNIIKKNRTY